MLKIENINKTHGNIITNFESQKHKTWNNTKA